MYAKYRKADFHLTQSEATKHYRSLPLETEPLMVPYRNKEDLAQGVPEPRVEGWHVIYWKEMD